MVGNFLANLVTIRFPKFCCMESVIQQTIYYVMNFSTQVLMEFVSFAVMKTHPGTSVKAHCQD